MTSVCFYFQIHQPFRLNWFWPENAKNWQGRLEDLYFDKPLNEFTFKKVAGKCYHKASDIILSQIDRFKKGDRKFKVSFSLSGTFLEQCERWDKSLLEKFKRMSESGCVEFLCETYYHSLASLMEDRTEFVEQVRQHQQAIKDLLGQTPKIFRNTELLYHNEIAKEVENMGFKAIMTEGIERILEGWKSPNFIYKRKDGNIKVLLRNYRLSDDIGYRFSSKWWSEYPLTADKYAAWLSASPGTTVNVFIDYETFGEHQWEDTGIFWFLGALPQEVLKWQNLEFATPSEVIERYPTVGEIDVPYYQTVSWADLERDASAWIGNHTQQMAFNQIKDMEKLVKKSGSEDFLKTWRYLQTGDHFYYMCTKCLADGDVHKYFSHHGNPHDAGVNYLAILADFKERILRYMHEKEKQAGRQAIPIEEPKIEVKQVDKQATQIEKPVEKRETIIVYARKPAKLVESKPVMPVQKPATKPARIIGFDIEVPSKPKRGYTEDTVVVHATGRTTQKEDFKSWRAEAEKSRREKHTSVDAFAGGHIIQGKKTTPQEKYGHAGKAGTQSSIQQTLTPAHTIIKGEKITPQEKYAAKYGGHEGQKNATGEPYTTIESTKNSQITRPKKITPGEKYKPKE